MKHPDFHRIIIEPPPLGMRWGGGQFLQEISFVRNKRKCIDLHKKSTLKPPAHGVG